MSSTEGKAGTDEVRGGFGGLGGEPAPLEVSSPSKPVGSTGFGDCASVYSTLACIAELI